MKLRVNMPDYEKGAVLEVMHVGPVENGSTVTLTDSQVMAMRDAGYALPDDGDGTFDVYQEPSQPDQEEAQTTNLPGIEEIAEQERKRSSARAEKTIEEVLKEVGNDPAKANDALNAEKAKGSKARATLVSQLESIKEKG